MQNGSEPVLTAEEWCGVDGAVLRAFVERLRATHGENESPISLREDIRRAFRSFVQARPREERRGLRTTLGARIEQTEEVIFAREGVCIILREEPGLRRAYLTGVNGTDLQLLNRRQLLSLREGIILGKDMPEEFLFGIDFRPFRIFPDEAGVAGDIGSGPMRVAKLLAQEVLSNPHETLGRVVDFLSDRRENGQALLFDRHPGDVQSLRRNLHRAVTMLEARPANEEIDRLLPDLALLGFAPGWGATAGRAAETLKLLHQLLLVPSGELLIELFARLPLMRRVVLVSVHGWFAQSNVFGRPDTGGQVVYVLDQARAIERHLHEVWRNAGVDLVPQILILTRLIPEAEGTTCDQARELVDGTENTWILRVPFRTAAGDPVPHWISRFHVWPYLDRFAGDAYSEVRGEYGGASPDVVVGNYSDGNMVAQVLGREWQVPIAVIAHALEKTKYLMSDLFWRDLEQDYHFSIHFLADILAANSADFIITSSYQEIAGTPREMGQYESYEIFTLPDRYRVLSGVNVKSARFVINPPGVDTETYRPYSEGRDHDRDMQREIEDLVFGAADAEQGIHGHFADPAKPIIFTMARMDRIKNLTGLVQVYAKRPALREAANLLIVSGVSNVEESQDIEERQQIERMHRLFDQHGLHQQVRWLPGRYGQHRVPHYYRFVAARRGVFVQPALFEAFGLTVLEAMISGLPVVATCFGGPASIIEDGVSGFLVDPNRAADVERAILGLLRGADCGPGDDLWDAVSHAGIRRVHEHFSWPGHARRLATSFGLYSLWTHIFPQRRQVRRSYVEVLHHLLLGRLISETWQE